MTIALTMIVRDEAANLPRCLDSVLPHVAAWAVVDTGSVDGTQVIVREKLGHLPGTLAEQPWRDFATARNDALGLARATGADFWLWLDADQELSSNMSLRTLPSTFDAFVLSTRTGQERHWCPRIVRASLPVRWEGEVHERLVGLDAPGLKSIRIGEAHAFVLDHSTYPPEKAAMRASVLRGMVAREPENPRHLFYFGRELRRAGRLDEALEVSRRRASMASSPNHEETFLSMLDVAACLGLIGVHADVLVEAFLDAHRFRPTRPEPLVAIAEIFLEVGDVTGALTYATQILGMPRSSDVTSSFDAAARAQRVLARIASPIEPRGLVAT